MFPLLLKLIFNYIIILSHALSISGHDGWLAIQNRCTKSGHVYSIFKCWVVFLSQEPQKKVLGTRRVIAKRNNKKRIVEVNDVFYYIPILETIEMQLSTSRRFLEMILGTQRSRQNDSAEESSCVFTDFSDGSVIRNHPIFAIDEYALRVLVYYDDINVINHMTNKVHKLGLFYYQLANIEAKYRSKTKSIHLFAICKNEYIKRYGMNTFLKPMVDDMKCLGQEDGYTFSICGGSFNLRGAILAVLADTPASQAAGGFKESVGGARRKCRHCMANFESMQDFFSEEDFMCRDRELHETQLNDIENAESKFLKNFFSKNFGINTRSALRDAPHFDVTKQLPQDLMHVFLEGIVAYELKFLLQHYIDIGEIKLNDLNSKIEKFSYGYSEVKDKPAEIKVSDLENPSNTNLGQSAAQMWELTCILPFVLESSIKDSESCYWRCFLSLLEIMSLCFARKITVNSVIYLKGLISEHLKQFKEIYGARIIPKQHYLVHIPSQIMMFGPLISAWCMRFEAKHSFFKDIARKVKNFKNLPFTLAMRHQSMESADTINLDGEFDPCPLFKDDFHCAKSKQLTGRQYEYAKNHLKRFYNTIDTGNVKIWECQSVTVYGTFYKPGNNNYLLIRITDDSLPEFGQLAKIWYASSYGPFFVLTVMETKSFFQDLNAFHITECNQAQGYEVISHSDLYDFKVLHAYRSSDSDKFILVKGNVLS